jgi:hypothetical protein
VIAQHITTIELAKRLSLNPETIRRAVARAEEEVERWLRTKRVDNSSVVPIRRQDRASQSHRRTA